MLVFRKCFFFTFVLFSIQQEAFSIKKGYYTIVAPATIRPESVFHVSFTLNDFHKSCWFNITLNDPDHNKIHAFENIEVKPGTNELVELRAPSFNNTYGYLEVLGYRGIISKDSEIINFHAYTDKFWIFIQTDKANYKPSETVQFRIICIDQFTRPAKLKEKINVEIYDGEHNLLRIIFDIEFVQGVFRGEFQLSEYPSLGQWTIAIGEMGRDLAFKYFQVERYELPKFNIEINTKEVSIYDEKMVFNISASYFYGEHVKGNLSFAMKNIDPPYQKITRQSRIDGKVTIVIDLKNDLQLELGIDDKISTPLRKLYIFHLEAVVIDELSEQQSRSGMDIRVFNKPYKIKLEAPNTFDSEELISFKVKVLITDLNDNLIQDTKNPIEIIVGCKEDFFQKDDITRIEYRNEVGKDFGIVQVTNKNYTECFLYAEYQKITTYKRKMYNRSPFEMEILTESPQQGKELEVKIKNRDPIDDFSYEVFSKGDIIKSDHVKIPGNATTFVFRFNVTPEMVPKITIYVHLINKMYIIGKMRDVFINKSLPNSIKITTERETKPGKSVSINITTDVGSYVGLNAIDRSANAFQSTTQKVDVFNEHVVNKQLSHYLNFYPDNIQQGRVGDIITFSNAFPPRKVALYGGEPPEYIRKIFADSWLFKDFEKTAARSFNILETVSDTITTWEITGFSINPITGLTFTRNATNLRVFQEFFIEMDLPSLVREGEIIEVPVFFNNYMKQDTLTSIKVESNNEDLAFLEHPKGTINQMLNFTKLLSAKNRDRIVFFIKPLKQGHYNVTVKAISSEASDAVQKILNVEPQGVPYAMSKTYLVHLPEESIQEDEITIDIPENAVPESQRVEITVVGDIFRPLMEKLQKLVQVPYGNGEDNIKLMVSNFIVLKYLKTLNYSNPRLENKIKEHLQLGYQNQLSFRYLDGSFGIFERKSERTGDVWQTILTLWGLEQVAEFIQVDGKVMIRGLEYLKSKQQENGCIKSKSDVEEDVKLTALGLMVFLLEDDTEYNLVISKSLEFLNETADDLEDSSISVLATYALLLGKHEMAADHLRKLSSNTRLLSKQILWTKSDTLQAHIEMTTGSLMNLLESQEIPEKSVLHIVRGLIVSKPKESSITHMIALQAMISILQKLSLSTKNLHIAIKSEQDQSRNFLVNYKNSQVLQTYKISKSCRKMKIQNKGQGFAMVDVRYNFNLLPEDQFSSYYFTNISTKTISKYLGVLKICSNTIYTNSTQNNLTIMEVHLQSGFVFTEKASPDYKTLTEDIKSMQVDNSRNKLLVNFELSTNEVCIEVEVHRSYKVFNSKPGWIIVYDALDKDQKATKSFSFNDLE